MKCLNQGKRLLRRRIYELLGNPRYSKPALNDLDDKLARHLNFRDGFLIEAGANDGYSQSNTYYLESMLKWQGVLVEAIPELYKKCRKQRRRAHVHHCALVAKDYKEPTVEMNVANLMSSVKGLHKTSEHGPHTVTVPARTLESILDECPQPLKIDCFSLDVEGYKLDVLKGLNLEKYSPRYLLIEMNFFEEVDAFLKHRYELTAKLTHHDCFYRLRQNS